MIKHVSRLAVLKKTMQITLIIVVLGRLGLKHPHGELPTLGNMVLFEGLPHATLFRSIERNFLPFSPFSVLNSLPLITDTFTHTNTLNYLIIYRNFTVFSC